MSTYDPPGNSSLRPIQQTTAARGERAGRSATAYPYTASALVIAAGLPVRFKIGFAVFGSFTLLDIVLAVAALRLLFGILASGSPVRIGDRRVTILLAIPFLVCVASLVWTDDLRATLRAIGMFTEAMVAYLVVTNAFSGLRPAQLFTRAAMLVALLLIGSLLSLLQVRGFGPQTPNNIVIGGPEHVAYLTTYYARLGNPFYGLSNDFASVLALYVFPLLAWGVVRRRLRYSLLAGVLFAGVALTLSRGVVIATVVGGILFLMVERQRMTRWLPGIGLGAALVLTIGYIYYQLNQAVQTHLLDRLTITTIQVRREILSRAFERISEAPILGYGAGVVTDPLLVDGVHNTYLQQALYYGIPLGLLCSGALWLLAARFFSWSAPAKAVRVMAIAIGVSVLTQLAVFVVETSFEATLPKTAFYFFVAFGSVVLTQMNRHELDSMPAAIATHAR
jgi:O-antigen ligase